MTYRGYPDPLVIHVRTSPGPGEFSTIQAAIASITDNSPTKPYVVDVDPGTWTITTTIEMKPYVNLQGATELTVLSWDGAASGHLIRGAPNTQIRDCILTNAIGVGATGYTIWYDGTSTDPQNPDPAGIAESFNLMDCGFGTAGKLGWVDGSVNPANVYMIHCYWGGADAFATGFEVVGGVKALLSMRSCMSLGDTIAAPLPSFFIKIYGANALASIIGTTIVTGGTGGTGAWIYNGAQLTVLGGSWVGWATAIRTELIGAAPMLDLIGVFLHSNTTALSLEHTGTVGSLSGSIDGHDQIVNNAPLFSWGYQDITDRDFHITDRLSVTYPLGTTTDVLPVIQNQGLGLISGGLLTAPGGLFVAVSDLVGYYINSVGEVARAALSAIPNVAVPDDTETYIFVNTNGAISTSGSQPAISTTILLGRVVTAGGAVTLLDHTAVRLNPEAQNYAEISKLVFGARYISGTVFSPGTTPLNLDVTAGRYYFGADEFLPGSGSDITFATYRTDGLGGWVVGTTTLLDDENYDNAGVLTAIPGGEYVKHAMYVLADTPDRYFLVYGQTTFASLGDAESGTLPSPPSYFKDGVVRVASFVIQKSAGLIASIISERPFSGTSPSGVAGASADHSGLLNLTAGDAGHTQFLMLNGTKPMAANLNMGGFAVTNVSTVDGVDVSTHASRHLPLGADALTTAAPLVDLSATSTNAVGTANSYARSDHSHAVDIVSQVITNGVTNMAPSEDAVFDALALKLDANAPIVGATNTKITYDADGLVTAGAAATTADIADSADRRYVTDAQLVVVGNTSGTNSGDNSPNSSTTYVGTTAVALNRASAPLTLTGITSIDGSAATLTTPRAINGVDFDGSAPITVTAEPDAHEATHRPGQPDALPTAAAGSLLIGAVAAEGVSTSFSRADHAHAFAAPPAPASVGAANATGVSTAVARADHVHNHGVQTDGTFHAVAIASGAAGFLSGADKAKLDGVADNAAALTSDAPSDATRAAAAVGVATTAARADHKHDVPVAAPAALVYGGAGATGVSTSLAAADHVHALGLPAGRIVSYNQAVGTTSGPTTSSTAYVLLSEMTVTMTPGSATNYIEVDFSGTFSNSNPNRGAFIAIFVDGVQSGSTERAGHSSSGGAVFTLSVRKMLQLSAASHTITIRWKVDANTATATGVQRILSVKETAS